MEKLQYVCDSLGQNASAIKLGEVPGPGRPKYGMDILPPSLIFLCLGVRSLDSFDTWFFAKTFPTLFPAGIGGPRQAEEGIAGVVEGVDATARNLVSSRNMSLETWARLVLQRHGGRFANHHVLSFLVFNMLVVTARLARGDY